MSRCPPRKDQEAALQAFVRHCQRRNLSPHTIETHAWVLGKFFEAVQKAPLEVTTQDVRAFLAARSPRRLAYELSTLRCFFRVVCDEPGAVLPTDGLRVGKSAPAPPLLLSPKSIEALLEAALEREGGRQIRSRPLVLRDRACLELLYGTAVRASELRAIRLVDLDLHARQLQVRPAKRGAPRLVPVPRAAVAFLRRYLRLGRPALVRPGVDDLGCVFLASTGRPWDHNEPGRTIRRVAQRAGLRAHPHAFRRALSTHLVREGVSVPAVRELLGHVSLATTARYVEVDRASLHQAVACLDLGQVELAPAQPASPPGSGLEAHAQPAERGPTPRLG